MPAAESVCVNPCTWIGAQEMNWWINPGNSTVVQVPDAVAHQRKYIGPFASMMTATDCLNNGNCVYATAGGGGGGGNIPPCHGTGAWFYNIQSGVLNRVPSLLQAPYLSIFGWRKLNLSYCANRDQAIAAATAQFPNGATPGGSLAGNAAKTAINSATGTQGFLHGLTQRSFVVRAAEVVIGVALLIVGVAKLAGDTPVGKIATKAGKAVALL